MDDRGEKIPVNIKWGENELVTEPLNSDPRLTSDLDFTSRTVEFGNTGFDVRFSPGGNAFDFMPEGQKNPVKEPPQKYVSFLGAGLLELRKLLKDKEKMSEFGLDQLDTSRISTGTNDYVSYALKNLFERSGVGGVARADYSRHVIEINLDAFRDLPEDNPLIVFLERASDRAHRNTVTYQKRIR